MRSGGVSLSLQSLGGPPGAPCRGLTLGLTLSFVVIPFSLPSDACGGFAAARRLQLHPCPPRLGQTDRDGLLRRRCSVFTFADVVHFLSNEFSCLGARRLSFTRIFTGAFNCLSFWHKHPPLAGSVGGESQLRHRRFYLRKRKHCCTTAGSICQQIHFVEPHAVGFLLVVAIHLEGDVDFFLKPVRLGREVGVDIVCLVIHIQ